jgi:hypothetical protein
VAAVIAPGAGDIATGNATVPRRGTVVAVAPEVVADDAAVVAVVALAAALAALFDELPQAASSAPAPPSTASDAPPRNNDRRVIGRSAGERSVWKRGTSTEGRDRWVTLRDGIATV